LEKRRQNGASGTSVCVSPALEHVCVSECVCVWLYIPTCVCVCLCAFLTLHAILAKVNRPLRFCGYLSCCACICVWVCVCVCVWWAGRGASGGGLCTGSARRLRRACEPVCMCE